MDLHDGGVDDTALVYALAERYGEIERISPTRWRLGVKEYKTKKDMVNAMMNDDIEAERLWGLILARAS